MPPNEDSTDDHQAGIVVNRKVDFRAKQTAFIEPLPPRTGTATPACIGFTRHASNPHMAMAQPAGPGCRADRAGMATDLGAQHRVPAQPAHQTGARPLGVAHLHR